MMLGAGKGGKLLGNKGSWRKIEKGEMGRRNNGTDDVPVLDVDDWNLKHLLVSSINIREEFGATLPESTYFGEMQFVREKENWLLGWPSSSGKLELWQRNAGAGRDDKVLAQATRAWTPGNPIFVDEVSSPLLLIEHRQSAPIAAAQPFLSFFCILPASNGHFLCRPIPFPWPLCQSAVAGRGLGEIGRRQSTAIGSDFCWSDCRWCCWLMKVQLGIWELEEISDQWLREAIGQQKFTENEHWSCKWKRNHNICES
jgi:hypothetical protein